MQAPFRETLFKTVCPTTLEKVVRRMFENTIHSLSQYLSSGNSLPVHDSYTIHSFRVWKKVHIFIVCYFQQPRSEEGTLAGVDALPNE